MRNAIITYAEGNDFVQTLDSEVFLHSLKKHKNFKKLVFTRGLTDQNLQMLSRFFDEVIVCQNPINNNARDRFMSYYQWMVQNSQITNLLGTNLFLFDNDILVHPILHSLKR